MEFKTLTACFFILACFLKLSDADITAWAVAGATVSGTDPAGIATVSIAENTAVGATLFTATATGATGPGYTFATNGNPDTIGVDPTAAGVVALATGKSFDFETTKSYVFMIVATETTDTTKSGTLTLTLSITDAVEFTTTAFCLSSSTLAAGASIGTLATDQSSPTYVTSLGGTDAASFSVDATSGAITVKTGQSLDATSQIYFVFTLTATKTDIATSDTTSIHILISCSSDSGAGQVAALLGVILLSVVTALFY